MRREYRRPNLTISHQVRYYQLQLPIAVGSYVTSLSTPPISLSLPCHDSLPSNIILVYTNFTNFHHFHSKPPHLKTLAMSTFNAVRNHLALIQNDADRLLKDINRLEEDHEENRTSIGQCDEEFAQAKAAEDKVHAELEKAWKKTDKFKNKQRKLVRRLCLQGVTQANHFYQDRRQADIQSEQAAKWGQYKIKSALVVSYGICVCFASIPNRSCSMNCASCAESPLLSQRMGSVLSLTIAMIRSAPSRRPKHVVPRRVSSRTTRNTVPQWRRPLVV